MKDASLIVILSLGEIITIPNLAKETIDLIFLSHLAYLEQETNPPVIGIPSRTKFAPKSGSFLEETKAFNQENETSLQFGLGSLNGLGMAMQHDVAHANTPDLPFEILQKIGAIAKIISPEDLAMIPKPEPHCNCPHCQIARAITAELTPPSEKAEVDLPEEAVAEEELRFQQWEICQKGDNFFTVTNRLDSTEIYNVFLGDSVGCTCGQSGCEHILAVLKS